MNSHFRKQLAEIERRAGIIILSTDYTGKGHLRLNFDGGQVVIGSTPSCPRAMLNAVSQIKRLVRTSHHAT